MLPGLKLWAAGDRGDVAGLVREKATGRPVEYAVTSLRQAGDSCFVAGCMTDSLGRFMFAGVPAGEYYVEGACAGNIPARTGVFQVVAHQRADAGTLYLTSSRQLEEVVVEAHRPAIVAKPDSKVYYAGRDVTAAAGSASDLMQNIPSVDVDMDGTVTLRGNSNVTVLINGKPSAAMGARTRGDALAQIPAADIERVEVFASPSAEYRPEGDAGIINIVLKKEARRGVNGSVAANVGSGGRMNAAVNTGYAFRNLNLFGGYAYRRDRYDRTTTDRRVSPDEETCQDTYGLGRPASHTARLSLDLVLPRGNTLEAAGSYTHRLFHRAEEMESETRNQDGVPTHSYTRERDAMARENIWEATFGYAHSYGENRQWGIGYTYSSESEDEMNHYTTVQSDIASRNNETVWDANRMHLVRLFWKHDVSARLRFASGYELEHLRAGQNFHVAEWNGVAFVPDRAKSSDFTHCMMLNSVYGTVEWSAGRWNIVAGVRGEYARIRNLLLSVGDTRSQSYFNVFPSLRISRQTGTRNELMISYSMRVNRPEGKDMNPFAEQINPLSLEAGNPDLKPEKIQALEAGWLWRFPAGGSLLATGYYRYVTDRITRVSRYVGSGILLTVKENMQSSQSAGLELTGVFPLARWLDVDLNLNGFYNEINASRLGFGKRRSTFSWSSLLTADFRPFRHCMVQMNVRYRSATLVPQGRRDADLRVNMGMRYDIPKTGLSLTASVTDLFDTYRKSFTLDTPELKQTVRKRRNPRIFYFGVTWQFGVTLDSKKTELEYDEGL